MTLIQDNGAFIVDSQVHAPLFDGKKVLRHPV